MSDPQQARFDGWAIVDVMGHQRYVGYVTTEAYGAAVLFRIDVPALEERERVTKRPGYIDGKYLPAGTTVKEGAVAGYSKLVGSGSIYTITPCTKEAALVAVEEMQARPLMSVALPPERTLAAAAESLDDDDQLDRQDDDFGGDDHIDEDDEDDTSDSEEPR
jgi:hypothetical protein